MTRTPQYTSRSAFTFIETIVVIALTTLIMGALTTLIAYFYKTNRYTLEQTMALGQARTGIEDTVRYLREASYGSDGSYPIASAGTSTVTVYANINSSPVVERITYRLLSGTLYRAVATPSGNPVTYAGASIATSTIATTVINTNLTPIFRYFDTAGTELSAPFDVSKIASIRINLIIDVNTATAPVSFTLTGAATLRNVQSQL